MHGIVQKIEAHNAHILFDDGQVLRVSLSELMPGTRVASVVDIAFAATPLSTSDAAGDASRQKLNDILSSRPE